jgi:hypothetical protein
MAVRYNIIGTHKGELEGIPPSSKEVSFSGMDFMTVINGKVVDEWEIADRMALMQQIGAIPASPSAGNGSSAASSLAFSLATLSWIDLRYMSQASMTSLVVSLSGRTCSAQSLAGILLIQICVEGN